MVRVELVGTGQAPFAGMRRTPASFQGFRDYYIPERVAGQVLWESEAWLGTNLWVIDADSGDECM
jgi:hypothetical protein